MSKFITQVIRMPDSPEARAAITSGIRDLVEKHGATITGQSTEDEMTLAEMFEKRLGQADVDEAREEAASIAEAN